MEQVGVLICESTPMACELLASALRQADELLNVVGSVTSGHELRHVVEKAIPQVVLISANLTEGPLAGIRALRELNSRERKCRAIVLQDSNDRELTIDAFRSGARGIFLRSEPVNMLPRAIRSVHSGQVWVNAKQLDFLLEALTLPPPLPVVNAKGESLLSKRQQELAALVAQGLTNHQIAEHLKLSEHTVKNYLFRIFDKLGISTRGELILYVLAQRPPQSTAGGSSAA